MSRSSSQWHRSELLHLTGMQMPTILTSLCVHLVWKLIRYLDMHSSPWPARQLRRTKTAKHISSCYPIGVPVA